MGRLNCQAGQILGLFHKSGQKHIVVVGDNYHADRLINNLRMQVSEDVCVYSGNQLGFREGVDETIPENFFPVYVGKERQRVSFNSQYLIGERSRL